jgi:hypothetical protein
MLTLPASVRIYVAAEPVDLRRGFDGLAAAARSLIGDAMSGHLFCFLNRRKNRIKLLVWDRTGYLLLYKRFMKPSSLLFPPRMQCCARPGTWNSWWRSCGTMWCCVGDERDVVFRYRPTGEGATGPWSFLAGRHRYAVGLYLRRGGVSPRSIQRLQVRPDRRQC